MKPIIIALLLLAGTAWGQQVSTQEQSSICPEGCILAYPQSIQTPNGIAVYPSIILVRTAYFDTDQKLNHILENDGPALLSNADYESIDHLEHAIHNTYLFLGTSEATEADAVKAQQNLDAMHLDAKLSKLLSKYHVPTHTEALDDLLRKQDGWADKL